MIIDGSFATQVKAATARFVSEVDDPKAAIISDDSFSSGQVFYVLSVTEYL